ncbi:uncharacterized protein L199_000971 [Kwoniella botswanensis]|uniref:uncharacterized protein n=1 Tax=Kwoniella botswanensis TaxID=1268659 RepID=UPI00315C673F
MFDKFTKDSGLMTVTELISPRVEITAQSLTHIPTAPSANDNTKNRSILDLTHYEPDEQTDLTQSDFRLVLEVGTDGSSDRVSRGRYTFKAVDGQPKIVYMTYRPQSGGDSMIGFAGHSPTPHSWGDHRFTIRWEGTALDDEDNPDHGSGGAGNGKGSGSRSSRQWRDHLPFGRS